MVWVWVSKNFGIEKSIEFGFENKNWFRKKDRYWFRSPTLHFMKVTRETLSSRAGAMVIYSNLIQEVAVGNLVTIFVCYQGGGPHA